MACRLLFSQAMLAILSIAPDAAFGNKGLMDHVDWLKAGLKQPGKTQKGLADALRIDATAVSKMLSGKRRLQLHEVPKASAYLGIDPPGRDQQANHLVAFAHPTTDSVPLRKIAAGGVWREKDKPMMLEPVAIPVVPEPRLRGLKQYATRIDGTDFNKMLRPGDYAILVSFREMRASPHDGDIVEVERRHGDLVETAIRRVRLHGSQVELWPESTEAEWQTPLRLTNGVKDQVEITGLYVGMFRPHTF